MWAEHCSHVACLAVLGHSRTILWTPLQHQRAAQAAFIPGAFGYGACVLVTMLATQTRSSNMRIRPWMAVMLLVLILGLGYIVVRDDGADDEPVPSPNFKSEEELGP